MLKNIVFSEYYYYFTLVLPIGLYINFMTNILSGLANLDFILLILSSIVTLFIFIVSINTLQISIDMKNNSIYNDYRIVFNNHDLKNKMYINSVIFIFFGMFVSFINHTLSCSECKSMFCGNNSIICFISLVLYLSFNSYLFYYPMKFINSIIDEDNNHKQIINIGVNTNDI